jgi:hypothetical protein
MMLYPDNMRQKVDDAVNMYQSEMTAVQETMNEYLAENIENDATSSAAQVVTQEQTTTRDDKKDKQGVSGEVGEGQESVQAEPVEGAGTQETVDGGVVQGETAATEETQTLGEQTPVIESERVTLNNTTNPDNPSQISYSIDVDGSSVGDVTGRYDSNGNFIIDDINVSEGEQGKEIASEVVDAITNETGGKVIISSESDNSARVGDSFEKKGNATRNENGDFVVEPIQEATQEEETQQEPTEEKPLEEREPKSVADKLRKFKIKRTKGDGSITLYAGLPVDPMREGFKAAWNGAIEVLATAIEKGGTAITNIKEALKQSKIRFQNSEFYQGLKTKEEKAEEMVYFLDAIQTALEEKKYNRTRRSNKQGDKKI